MEGADEVGDGLGNHGALSSKDYVNVKGHLWAHTRSWASMPRRQVGHLRGRVSEGMLLDHIR